MTRKTAFRPLSAFLIVALLLGAEATAAAQSAQPAPGLAPILQYISTAVGSLRGIVATIHDLKPLEEQLTEIISARRA